MDPFVDGPIHGWTHSWMDPFLVGKKRPCEERAAPHKGLGSIFGGLARPAIPGPSLGPPGPSLGPPGHPWALPGPPLGPKGPHGPYSPVWLYSPVWALFPGVGPVWLK